MQALRNKIGAVIIKLHVIRIVPIPISIGIFHRGHAPVSYAVERFVSIFDWLIHFAAPFTFTLKL
jgi:hypothetical protein